MRVVPQADYFRDSWPQTGFLSYSTGGHNGFRARLHRITSQEIPAILVVSRRLCLALHNLLWKPKSIGRRGRPCWLSRLSILCGDPHFSQFVLAFAKFRRFFWRRCVSLFRDSFFLSCLLVLV